MIKSKDILIRVDAELKEKAKEQSKKTLSIEEVTEQFKRIRKGRIDKDNPQ